jgi:hypothetical protein
MSVEFSQYLTAMRHFCALRSKSCDTYATLHASHRLYPDASISLRRCKEPSLRRFLFFLPICRGCELLPARIFECEILLLMPNPAGCRRLHRRPVRLNLNPLNSRIDSIAAPLFSIAAAKTRHTPRPLDRRHSSPAPGPFDAQSPDPPIQSPPPQPWPPPPVPKGPGRACSTIRNPVKTR